MDSFFVVGSIGIPSLSSMVFLRRSEPAKSTRFELAANDALGDAGAGALLNEDGEDRVGAVGLPVELVLGGRPCQLSTVEEVEAVLLRGNLDLIETPDKGALAVLLLSDLEVRPGLRVGEVVQQVVDLLIVNLIVDAADPEVNLCPLRNGLEDVCDRPGSDTPVCEVPGVSNHCECLSSPSLPVGHDGAVGAIHHTLDDIA